MTIAPASATARPTAAPAAVATAAAGTTTPSQILLPLDFTDAGPVAATSFAQAGSYVTMLRDALAPTVAGDRYTTLVKRGLLDDAVAYAKYGSEALRIDKNPDNDQFRNIVDAGLVAVLQGVQQLGAAIPAERRDAVALELELARTTAANVERHLDPRH